MYRHLALLAVVLGLVLAPAVAQAAHPRVQSHSMIHICCMPDAEQEHFMAAAKASGASIVRLDVEVHGIVHWSPFGHHYDFSKLDRIVALGRRYDLRILGILSGTPAGLGECPPGVPFEDSWKCAPADPAAYAEHVEAIMEHAGDGVFAWEFWNEPDLDYMYLGSPEVYGRTLGAIYERAAGRFLVTGGGISDSGLPFMQRAVDAGARFDIGNIHLRGAGLEAKLAAVVGFFGDRPLWVTEHGYSSHPDPSAQVRYLEQSIPALRAGGADEVFVTLRDIDEFGADSPFASEGILGKPAWELVVAMNAEPASAPAPAAPPPATPAPAVPSPAETAPAVPSPAETAPAAPAVAPPPVQSAEAVSSQASANAPEVPAQGGCATEAGGAHDALRARHRRARLRTERARAELRSRRARKAPRRALARARARLRHARATERRLRLLVVLGERPACP
jgi:hypothetical protein